MILNKSRGIVIIFLLLIPPLIWAEGTFVPARTPPPRTIEYRGLVTINGSQAADGSNVSVYGNNGALLMDTAVVQFGLGFYDHLEIIWDDDDTHTDDSNCSTYLPPPNGTCKVCVPGSCDEGITFDDTTYEHITFKVNGVAVTTPSYLTVGTFEEGDLKYQDLVIGNVTVTTVNCSVSTSLANDGVSVFINWSSDVTPDSFSIYYDNDATKIVNLNVSNTTANITGITGNNYTDINASLLYQQRYYAVSAVVGGNKFKCEQLSCMYNVNVVTATGIPSVGTDLNLISLPCTPIDNNINSIVTGASNNDLIYSYNTGTQNYESTQYFTGFGWFGAFSTFDNGAGYAFKPVAAPYNLTVVGELPRGNFTVNLKNATGIPSVGVDLNLIGWHSPISKCGLSSFITNASNNDVIYRYNTGTQNYESTQYFTGFGWFGAFDCLEPPRAYEFKPVAQEYNWSYERGG